MQIGSELNKNATYEKNLQTNREKFEAIEKVAAKTRAGGGAKAVERLHAKGKLSARERIELLVDPGSYFMEVGLHTAYGFYEEQGGAPSAGVASP